MGDGVAGRCVLDVGKTGGDGQGKQQMSVCSWRNEELNSLVLLKMAAAAHVESAYLALSPACAVASPLYLANFR